MENKNNLAAGYHLKRVARASSPGSSEQSEQGPTAFVLFHNTTVPV